MRRPRALGRDDGLFYDRLVTPDGTAVAGQGPVDGRASSRCWPPSSSTSDARPGRDGRASVSPRFLDATAAATGRARRRRAAARRAGDARLLFGVVGVDRLRADARHAVRPGRVPLARTGCGRSRPATATTRTVLEVDGVRASDRLRARRVDHRDVRRQLQLARAGVVPAELPRHRRARRYYRFFGDDLQVEYPTGSGRRLPLDASPTTCGSGSSRSSPSGPTGGARASAGSSGCRHDPRWQGQHDVQRVLPRRQRRRPRRDAPDRLDGPRGRPDPPPPQGRPPTFEVVQRLLTTPAPPPE